MPTVSLHTLNLFSDEILAEETEAEMFERNDIPCDECGLTFPVRTSPEGKWLCAFHYYKDEAMRCCGYCGEQRDGMLNGFCQECIPKAHLLLDFELVGANLNGFWMELGH